MEIRPKAFCTQCYSQQPYHIESSMKSIKVREVSFDYLETRAICNACGTVVYVPAVSDKNSYERHKAYYNKLDQELNINGDH